MKSRRKTNQIKFRESIMVQLREGGEAYVLDQVTSIVLPFVEQEAKIIKVIFEWKEERALQLENLVLELNRTSPRKKMRRDAVLAVLRNLAALQVIEDVGVFAPRTRGALKLSAQQSLALGAITVGAGLVWSPATAQAYMDCIGPPSCTAQGGTCKYMIVLSCGLGGYNYACNAGCS